MIFGLMASILSLVSPFWDQQLPPGGDEYLVLESNHLDPNGPQKGEILTGFIVNGDDSVQDMRDIDQHGRNYVVSMVIFSRNGRNCLFPADKTVRIH